MTTENGFSKKRRVVFKITDKEFQVSFLFFIFMIGFLTTLTSVITIMFIISSFSSTLTLIPSLDWEQIQDLLEGKVNMAWNLTIVMIVANLTATSLLSFLFSHRISGILLRVNQTLKSWMAGEQVTQIVPRKGDFFGELVETVNKITQSKSGQ